MSASTPTARSPRSLSTFLTGRRPTGAGKCGNSSAPRRDGRYFPLSTPSATNGPPVVADNSTGRCRSRFGLIQRQRHSIFRNTARRIPCQSSQRRSFSYTCCSACWNVLRTGRRGRLDRRHSLASLDQLLPGNHVLTNITRFGLPAVKVLPSHIVAVLSLVALFGAIVAMYWKHLEGGWRRSSTSSSLYLNVFVLVVQLLQKTPALATLAPSPAAPVFAATQGIVLVLFAVLGWAAVKGLGAPPDLTPDNSSRDASPAGKTRHIAMGELMKSLSIAASASLFLASCASTSWPTDADSSVVSDAPDHFLVLEAATGATSEPSGPACRSPMTDPRNGTRLALVRSKAGFGDYQPDTQRYGLVGNQLLRINCSDGRPVGATAGGTLTIHSSRSRFTARLESGVGPHGSKYWCVRPLVTRVVDWVLGQAHSSGCHSARLIGGLP